MATPQQVLLSFYRRSYPKHLGIDFPTDPEVFPSLASYVTDTYSAIAWQQVLSRLNHYRSFAGPRQKIGPLLSWLAEVGMRPTKLLDFGCGSGLLTRRLVEAVPSVHKLYCIDSDPSVSEAIRGLFSDNRVDELFTGSSIPNGVGSALDFITAVHTLHHIEIDQQLSVVSSLVRLLAPRGILYLYEDSWSDSLTRSPDEDLVEDALFRGLSPLEKSQLFRANDHFSNHFAYGRMLDVHSDSYRSREGWANMMAELGLSVLASGSTGFDLGRLHGVPSSWIVAQKK